MSENSLVIIPPDKVEGEVVGRDLGFPDPDAELAWFFVEFMQEMARHRPGGEESDGPRETPEEQKKREKAELEETLVKGEEDYKDWYLSRTKPEEAEGFEKLVRMFLPDELEAIAIEFVAGKLRFSEVIPEGATLEVIWGGWMSISARHSVHVMMLSSLYWQEHDGTIDRNTARLKARDLIWLFAISTDRWGLEDSKDDARRLEDTVKEYNGVYPWYEPDGYDGCEKIRHVRERLRNKPVIIPDRLLGWISDSRRLMADFKI